MAQLAQGLECIVTCGETVKFWDLVTLSNHHTVSKFGTLKCFDYNKTNFSFVSLPAHGKSLIFTKFTTEFNDCEKQLKIDEKITFIRFAKRHLLLGCSSGELLYLETESLKIIKKFGGHNSEIITISVSPDEIHFASGAMDGTIYIHNLIYGTGEKLRESPTATTVRSLCYNPRVKSMLASACDNGSVTLWNVNKKTMFKRFDQIHKAPAMDFAYSTCNPHVGVSVGLDRRVVLYDVVLKISICEFLADEFLRSVVFNSVGNSIIVGTTKGQIYQYDLAQSKNSSLLCTNVVDVQSSAVLKVLVAQLPLGTDDHWINSYSPEIASPIFSNTEYNFQYTNTFGIISPLQDFDSIISPIQSTLEFCNSDYAAIYSSEKNLPLPVASRVSLESSPSTLSYTKSATTTNAVKVTPKLKKTLTPIELFLIGTSNQNDYVATNNDKKENPTEPVLPKDTNCNLHFVSKDTVPLENICDEKPLMTTTVTDNSQLADLKKHLSEIMSDIKHSQHLEYMNLLTKMVKFNVDLQDEVKCLRKECKNNHELLEEVLALREENIRLKSAF